MKKISQASTTAIIVALTIFILIIYDIYAYNVDGQSATISYLIITKSFEFPLIPLCGGVLVGHFWWPLKKKPCKKCGFLGGR